MIENIYMYVLHIGELVPIIFVNKTTKCHYLRFGQDHIYLTMYMDVAYNMSNKINRLLKNCTTINHVDQLIYFTCKQVDYLNT